MKPRGVEQHALMFAFVARAAVERLGEPGRQAVLEGVRRYGHHRGERMAEHAAQAGLERNMASFMVCGEVNFQETDNVKRVDSFEPLVQIASTHCSWNDAWIHHDLLQYGRLYCEEIDSAIAEGFDPGLGFELHSSLSHGDGDCRFIYHGACLGSSDLARMEQDRTAVGSRFLRPWVFHIADLYTTMRQVLTERCGDAGALAAQTALDDFGEEYGASVMEALGEAVGRIQGGASSGQGQP